MISAPCHSEEPQATWESVFLRCEAPRRLRRQGIRIATHPSASLRVLAMTYVCSKVYGRVAKQHAHKIISALRRRRCRKQHLRLLLRHRWCRMRLQELRQLQEQLPLQEFQKQEPQKQERWQLCLRRPSACC